MALAQGNRVYLNVNAGLMSDPPLFGVVDYVNGASPDVVRVCWENGMQSTFSTADEALNLLVAFTEGTPVPTYRRAHGIGELRRLVTASGTLVLTRTPDGLYALVAD